MREDWTKEQWEDFERGYNQYYIDKENQRNGKG